MLNYSVTGIELSFIQKLLAFSSKREMTEFITKIGGKTNDDGSQLN